MVISDRHRYLYFVIPKCGSATVRHALEPYTDIGYPVTAFEEHVTIEKFRKKYDQENRFDHYLKFTFVRNPYDRLYSGFRQDMTASTRWKQWIAAKKPIFDEIGDDFNAYMQRFVASADLRHAWDWVCFCPMVAFTHRNGQRIVDWFGRTERLDKDINALARKLDIEIGELGKHNMRNPDVLKTMNEPLYLGHYTRQTVALVNDLYAEDFEAFGYPIRNPDDFPARL